MPVEPADFHKTTEHLQRCLQEKDSNYRALQTTYDEEQREARRLVAEIAAQKKETQRVKEQAEGLLRDAAAELEDVRRERDEAQRAQTEVQAALFASQGDAKAAETALCDLLAEHVALQQQYQTLQAQLAAAPEKVKAKPEPISPKIDSRPPRFDGKAPLRIQSPEHSNFQSRLVLPPSPRPTVSPTIPPAPPSHLSREARERRLYVDFMQALPSPSTHLPWDENKPVGGENTMKLLDPKNWSPSHPRQFLYLPKRTVWCTPERIHALAFGPTHAVSEKPDSRNPWERSSTMTRRIGKDYDLFMIGEDGSDPDRFYYVGIYRVLSLRDVHEPGSVIPTDVSLNAILRGMRLKGPQSTSDHLRLTDIFPDGLPRTECFGLQCVGFDWTLWRELRAQYVADHPTAGIAPAYAARDAALGGKQKHGWTAEGLWRDKGQVAGNANPYDARGGGGGRSDGGWAGMKRKLSVEEMAPRGEEERKRRGRW
ncbi:hypothetical protein MKEN_00961100 [Mycena kentingensis (nom. inval.)]|nr:hypothetical protein MKEN_00961100 [Mycena kentingensis (nom. inval.)]